MPVFTVIMATWGRGRHILPSIQSVLQQSLPDFELIVVGDACTDETESVVTGIADPRVRWMNLTSRCGSQAAPNNAGIVAAKGDVIAYLGHDDIWEPNHLAELARIFSLPKAPDFAVSGLIAHLPNGLQGAAIKGLLAEDHDTHRHFFPPSSFAHRRDVPDRIGPWGSPMDLRAPVDVDFLLRANAADMRFVSTGVVTVHKFPSAQRYLDYLQHRSDEQAAMLADMTTFDHSERIAAIVEASRLTGRFMPETRPSYDHLEPGELARISAARRGVSAPMAPLGAGACIRQRPEDCALDWHPKPIFGTRMHRRNPRPRLLLPFTAKGPVAMTIQVVHPDRNALGQLDLVCNEVPVTAELTRLRRGLWGWTARYRAVVELYADRPSVMEIHLDKRQQKKLWRWRTWVGFGIGKLRLTPLKA